MWGPSTLDMKTHQPAMHGGDLSGDLELAANALGVCDDAAAWRWRWRARRIKAAVVLFEPTAGPTQLNRMHLLTEALRSFVMRVAWEHDHKVHSANAGLP